jgi:hypothetical protein
MGALGGGCWHMYRGLKNSPKGYKVAGALDVSVPPMPPAAASQKGHQAVGFVCSSVRTLTSFNYLLC